MLQERPRILVLNVLEIYARERDTHVVLERVSERDEWICVLRSGRDTGLSTRCVGKTARSAIMAALQHEGIEVPEHR